MTLDIRVQPVVFRGDLCYQPIVRTFKHGQWWSIIGNVYYDEARAAWDYAKSVAKEHREVIATQEAKHEA